MLTSSLERAAARVQMLIAGSPRACKIRKSEIAAGRVFHLPSLHLLRPRGAIKFYARVPTCQTRRHSYEASTTAIVIAPGGSPASSLPRKSHLLAQCPRNSAVSRSKRRVTKGREIRDTKKLVGRTGDRGL